MYCMFLLFVGVHAYFHKSEYFIEHDKGVKKKYHQGTAVTPRKLTAGTWKWWFPKGISFS